ncbi:polysaccharide deacetylase [Paraburkholderia dipogonis]|uniref:Polysaccharide deacetylase n=1 Tax=Paraburkholderia dipogonis TaxID=1211383 RepID=A0ABW9B3F1_9BURK
MKSRYALLTVDTEALPKRASGDHVKRLMWGEHENGTAGVREMCAIGDEFGVKHVFFVDLCGAYKQLDQSLEVVRWLDAAGQDVQLHTHPEYLPHEFWTEHGLERRPEYMNQYKDDARAEFVLRHFGSLITEATGKSLNAFRAGSFRWNASTIRALKTIGVPLSFNNSMCAVYAKQSLFAEPTNAPYIWSNGVIEVPTTEKRILPKIGKDEWWARLTYPESSYFRFRPWWGRLLLNTLSGSPDFSVFLLHSWSLLYWDEKGYGCYRDDQRIEGYRKLMAQLTKDYDVITTTEFLDLYARGKISASHKVDVSRAELALPVGEGR